MMSFVYIHEVSKVGGDDGKLHAVRLVQQKLRGGWWSDEDGKEVLGLCGG